MFWVLFERVLVVVRVNNRGSLIISPKRVELA